MSDPETSDRSPIQTIESNINEFARWVFGVDAAVRSAVSKAIEAAGPALNELARDIADLGVAVANANEAIRYWDDHAPRVLGDSVGRAGLLVPISRVTLADVVELLNICDTSGSEAAIDRIRRHYDEIFEAPGFIRTLQDAWEEDPHLRNRMPVLAQAFKAHQQGMYAVSIPVFVAQCEGLVADLMNHHGIMKTDHMHEYIEELAWNEPWTARHLSIFFRDVLFEKFGHGCNASTTFSRHAIMHGGSVDYGTEINSRTAIILLDNIRYISSIEIDARN